MDVLGLTYTAPSYPYKITDTHPYQSSISSSASSSSSSLFSVDCASSQGSVSSTSTNVIDVIWENEVSRPQTSTESQNALGTACALNEAALSSARNLKPVPRFADTAVPTELRQHPRRTHPQNQNGCLNAYNASACPRQPPSLVRQCDRKINFVDNLVDSASQIVETIWPLSVVACRSDSSLGGKGVLPLRTFIQETLRRSKTSYSTLQVALYYLIMIKPFVPKHDFTMEQPPDGQSSRAMQCGRRMFLAALILASKYLQDRNYSARAWSKISGLNTTEINTNELTFLSAVNWKLHISEATFQKWTDIVLKFTPISPSSSPPTSSPVSEGESCWRSIIPKLTPELDNIDIGPNDLRTANSGFPSDMGMSLSQPYMACETPIKCSSNENTPTNIHNIPLTLEPTPRTSENRNPSVPPMPRMGLLPTPQMTPQSTAVNTPAASICGFGMRRPSMCSAISQVQNACLARTTLDQRLPSQLCRAPGTDMFPTSSRRSSLAQSMASSPESMVSDVSSRSSRSSSISSIASSTCAPIQPRLAVQATRRCANMQTSGLKESRRIVVATPSDDKAYHDVYSSPESYCGPIGPVPDFSNFSLNTPRECPAPNGARLSTQEAAQGLCELSTNVPRTGQLQNTTLPTRCRKRGRPSSEDLSLHQHVRDLLPSKTSSDDDSSVLPDCSIADSFLVSTSDGLQSPVSYSGTPIVALQKTTSRKRACCGEEAAKAMGQDISGPGMWAGILE